MVGIGALVGGPVTSVLTVSLTCPLASIVGLIVGLDVVTSVGISVVGGGVGVNNPLKSKLGGNVGLGEIGEDVGGVSTVGVGVGKTVTGVSIISSSGPPGVGPYVGQ